MINLLFDPDNPSQTGFPGQIGISLVDPNILGYKGNIVDPATSFQFVGQVYDATPNHFTLDSKFGLTFSVDPLTLPGSTPSMKLCMSKD